MKKKIYISEQQYKRIFLGEQDKGFMRPKEIQNSQANKFIDSGGPSLATTMDNIEKSYVGSTSGTEMMLDFVNFLDRVIGKPTSKWWDQQVRGYDDNHRPTGYGFERGYMGNSSIHYPFWDDVERAHVWRETKRAASEIGDIPPNFLKIFTEILFESSTWEQVWAGIKEGYKTVTDKTFIEHLEEIYESFKKLWNKLSKELFIPVKDFIVDCATEVSRGEGVHCLLDMASVVVLVIPGYGILISGALDAINCAIYLVEASNMEPGLERDMYYAAAGLTLFGSLASVKYSRQLFKGGSKEAQEAITNYNKGLIELEKSGKLQDKASKSKLYDNTFGKLEDYMDKQTVKNYYQSVAKASKDIEKQLINLEKLPRKTRVDLEIFLKEPPANFQKYLDNANGDLWKALDAFRRTKAGYEALVQTGLFVGLGTVLPPLVVKTYKWYQEEVKKGNYGGRHIKTRVIANGFPWEDTKDIFGAISTDDPNYTKEKSEADNTLLKDAWEAGWRPWDPEKKDEEGRVIEIPVPEEFWTDEYRNRPKIGEWFDIEDPETLEQLKKLINNEEFDE